MPVVHVCVLLHWLVIANAVSWKIQTAPHVLGGSSLSVYWETTASFQDTNWIGLYRINETPNVVGATWWKYLDNKVLSANYSTTDSTNSEAFVMPTKDTLPWIFYILSKNYTVLAQSGPITSEFGIHAQKTAVGLGQYISGLWKWENFQPQDGDTVGLYVVNTTTRLWWQTTCTLFNCPNVSTFDTSNNRYCPSWRTPTTPGPAGPWEFRYYRQKMHIGTSRPIQFVSNVQCLPKNAPKSTIQNIIVFATENHSFDSFFGRYCRAKPFSNPTCTKGPSCCEAPPACYKYFPLTDAQNTAWDPCHAEACERSEININGTGNAALCQETACMGKYFSGGKGSDPRNLVTATPEGIPHYLNWITRGAMSDRFYQSSAGASSENDMYLAYTRYLFEDNSFVPDSKYGVPCQSKSSKKNFLENSIGDLLNFCNISWGVAVEGYNVAKAGGTDCYPSGYDASDIGLAYSAATADDPAHWFDSDDLLDMIHNGTLPSVVFARSLGIHSEHPGITGSLLSSQKYIQRFIDAVDNSIFWNSTLILVIPDESGGFYDHICPRVPSPVDGRLYGPRTPFVAIGYHTNPGTISHVELETSSAVRFIEWNWLAGNGGQLKGRDMVVNNIGSLLDSSKTGIRVPTYQ